MAVYNGARYLREQLDSLIDQVRVPDEIVICDDASTDGSRDILADFVKRAPMPVRLLLNTGNRGYSRAFEQCMNSVSGDLVFFCDQDDVWLPGKIDTVARQFEHRPGLMLSIHDGRLVDGGLGWHGAKKIAQVESIYPLDRFVTGSLSAASMELVRLSLPFPEGIVHDSWLHALAEALHAREILRQDLQLIRRHDGNASNGFSSAIKPLPAMRRLAVKLDARDDGYWDSFLLLDEEVVTRIDARYTQPPHALDALRARAAKMRRWRPIPGYRYLCKLFLK